MFPQCCRLILKSANNRTAAATAGRSVRRPLSLSSNNEPAAPSKDDNTNSNNTSSMANQKRLLANAALKKIPHHGWTQDAITAAVIDHPQMSISMSGLLTPTELVNWLMDDWNEQIKQKMQNDEDISPFDAIQWRLEQVIPLVQSGKWQQGMALGLSTPMTTQSQLHEFVEIIAPSNSSTMYKTGLGGVFVSTELFLLADTSVNYQETWSFLRQRLQELNDGKFVNIFDNGSIPMAAGTAIASSLMEGVASILMPTAASPSGTMASDYKPNTNQR